MAKVWRIVSQFLAGRWRFRRLRGEALRRYQAKQADVVFAHAVAHSPFFRALASSASSSSASSSSSSPSWSTMPVIDKARMMQAFDTYNTRGVTAAAATALATKAEQTRDFTPRLDGLTVGLSSGTSGHRTISLLDDDELYGFVGFMLGRMLDGLLRPRRLRVAFFMRANSNAYEASRSAFVDFRYFDLTLDDDVLVERLTALMPTVLLGPPAMLGVIARLQDEGRLRLAPEIVFSVAEVLEPQQRARIEASFGVMVREVYHTSEGLLGVSCRAGRLHIPEDVSLVELEPLGDGRYTPVMTQLHRFVLPIIRYRMNDIITLDERPCPCGSAFRVIDRVEGRCDDVFELHGDDGRVARVFPDVIRQAVIATDGVVEYRAAQTGPRRVEVFLEPARDHDAAAVAAAVTSTLRARLPAVAGLEVVVATSLPPEPDRRRKLVRVRRQWRPDSAARPPHAHHAHHDDDRSTACR